MAKRTESKSPLLQADEDVVLDVVDGWESTRSEAFRSRSGMKRNHCRQRGTSRDAVRPSMCLLHCCTAQYWNLKAIYGTQGGRGCTDGQALDASPDTDRCVGSDYEDQMPDGMHEAIQDAVSGAVNDAVQEHLEVQPSTAEHCMQLSASTHCTGALCAVALPG